eukprot:m.56534 g.56534  ORF g.56534 m.56534 type:complete len:212 (-) comp13395_c3_seq1:1659-2294(-)
MSSKPELFYFQLPHKSAGGRAGYIRLALEYAGWEYEDRRITFAEWPQYKEAQPLKQLPVFTYKGRQIVQSEAILRFIGSETGTYPTDSTERLNVDEIFDTVSESLNNVPRGGKDVDADKLKTLREEYVNGRLHELLTFIDKKIAGYGGPYATGKNVTIADFYLYGVTKTFESGLLDHVPSNLTEKYPNITATRKAVEALPKIAAFFATHDA